MNKESRINSLVPIINGVRTPKYSHLGKKIKFADLPTVSQVALMEEYLEIWGILLSEIGGAN